MGVGRWDRCLLIDARLRGEEIGNFAGFAIVCFEMGVILCLRIGLFADPEIISSKLNVILLLQL